MNRRKFLATLFGAGVALVAAPTLLALMPEAAPLALAEPITDEMMFERYIRPAAQQMADVWDRHAFEAIQRG